MDNINRVIEFIESNSILEFESLLSLISELKVLIYSPDLIHAIAHLISSQEFKARGVIKKINLKLNIDTIYQQIINDNNSLIFLIKKNMNQIYSVVSCINKLSCNKSWSPKNIIISIIPTLDEWTKVAIQKRINVLNSNINLQIISCPLWFFPIGRNTFTLCIENIFQQFYSQQDNSITSDLALYIHEFVNICKKCSVKLHKGQLFGQISIDVYGCLKKYIKNENYSQNNDKIKLDTKVTFELPSLTSIVNNESSPNPDLRSSSDTNYGFNCIFLDRKVDLLTPYCRSHDYKTLMESLTTTVGDSVYIPINSNNQENVNNLIKSNFENYGPYTTNNLQQFYKISEYGYKQPKRLVKSLVSQNQNLRDQMTLYNKLIDKTPSQVGNELCTQAESIKHLINKKGALHSVDDLTDFIVDIKDRSISKNNVSIHLSIATEIKECLATKLYQEIISLEDEIISHCLNLGMKPRHSFMKTVVGAMSKVTGLGYARELICLLSRISKLVTNPLVPLSEILRLLCLLFILNNQSIGGNSMDLFIQICKKIIRRGGPREIVRIWNLKQCNILQFNLNDQKLISEHFDWCKLNNVVKLFNEDSNNTNQDLRNIFCGYLPLSYASTRYGFERRTHFRICT